MLKVLRPNVLRTTDVPEPDARVVPGGELSKTMTLPKMVLVEVIVRP